ncbi:MAG: redoxin domain-containing protein [Chloroflexota bacterium]|nr:redoxin domain-containing protein [Chloroflexota bacterium]
MQSATHDVKDIEVGQPAPDFTLENQDGTRVQLSQLRGQPVVLLFYPFDWSGTCTSEVCSIRDKQADWESTGARVFGISRDSRYSHKAWRDQLGLSYDLLADLNGEVARQFNAWNESAHRADRVTVVVDPEGTVRYVVHNEAGKARNQDEVLAAVRDMVQTGR